MSIFTGLSRALLALSAAVAVAAAPVEPTLKHVVARLGRYVAGYGERMSVLVGIEHYDQQVVETNARRSLVSEIAFIPARGDWLTYRDVSEVDGETIADRTDRLQRLFVDSPQTAYEQARRIADESARFNLGAIQRNFNTPTMCLFAMRPDNLGRFKFKKAGEEPAGERWLWKVHFEEKDRPTMVRTPEGKSLPMIGHVWVQPADGAVFRTEMTIEGEIAARVFVDYEIDPRLSTMLPVRMHETYHGTPSAKAGARETSTVECRARYSDFKRFETSTRLVIPKQPPRP